MLAAWLFLVIPLAAQPKAIRLRNEVIHPTPPAAAAARPGPADERNVSGLYLIQFADPVQPAWREQLSTLRVELLRYVPEDSFVARLDNASLKQIKALPFVPWVGEYRPEHKIHPAVRAHAAARPGEDLALSVLLASTAAPAEKAEAKGWFRSLQQESRLRHGSILRGKVAPGRLQNLAQSPAVLWIEPAPKMKLFDEVASDIVAGDGGEHLTQMQVYGFAGNGVTVAVADTGLNNGDAATMHPDLAGRVPAFFYYGNLTDAADGHSHGTHVAGIIAGNGATGEVDDYGALYGLGVAPEAQIVAQRIFDDVGNYEPPASFGDMTHDALEAGAEIGSNSWGDDTQGQYDLSAMEFDELVRDADPYANGDQPYILEFSAGNAGPGVQTVGSPAVAKNVIATGASQNNRLDLYIYAEGPDAMADFSSRGPCEDGRIKPDVVAPGTWISSLKSASATDENAWMGISDNYLYQGGTSQAGPHVSGAAAVLVQYFREQYGMAHPSPALVKAALINSAVDMDDASGTGPAPNADEGWGRVDLTQIVYAARKYEFVDQTVPLATGQVYEKRVIVAASDEPLKITLAYSDAPGFPAALPALVNDLDLEVVGPDGTVYRGNQFADGESLPNPPDADHINNVEGVHLWEPLPGEYLVRVTARSIVEDVCGGTAGINQDFALVVSGNIPWPGVGLVLLDRRAYTAPSQIALRLIDSDLSGQPSATVQLRSTTEAAGETITLRVTGSPGTFTGTVATVTGPAVADGRLQIAHGDTIEAIYQDASSGTRTATARADLVPPVLTNVAVTNEFGSMLITWQSDEPANSIVRYNTNTPLVGAVTNVTLTQDHEVRLADLVPGATYQFQVISYDEAGNCATNNNGGAYYSFVAVAAAPVLLVNAYVHDDVSDSEEIPLSAYTNALNQTGIPYEIWDVNERNASPQLAHLRAFKVVIWRVSDSIWTQSPYATLDSSQQTSIQNYLNGGGAFFMASMEMLSRLGDVPFRRNVLQVQRFLVNTDPFGTCTDCDEDFGVPAITGQPSDPITAGVSATLDYSHYPYIDFFDLGPDFSDTFLPGTNATAILFETLSGKPCGMKYPRTGLDSTGRVVFLSFPFDTIPENDPAPGNRGALLGNILRFLAPGLSSVGTIALDHSEYSLPDLATVEVADADLAGSGQMTVNCSSDTAPAPASLTLRETARPGVFRGTITLVAATAPPAGGQLRAAHGDTIYADYFDASGQTTLRAQAIVDALPPEILNVTVETGYEEALISWETTEPADALVQFGESVFFGRTAYQADLGYEHELYLSGLAPDRLYYFQVVSRDAARNAATDNNGGRFYTFQTLRAAVPPWSDSFDSGATEWTVQSDPTTQIEWTLGVPDNSLATEAYSPPNAWGSNLRGELVDSVYTTLISPAIDLRGIRQATLRFWHNYALSDSDLTIESAELQIYYSGLAAPVSLDAFDGASAGWEEYEFDLSPYTGRVVYLIWDYFLFDLESYGERPGWLVDDVSVVAESEILKMAIPVVLPNRTVRLEWTSVADRIYRVLGSTDAAHWTPVSDWITATGSATTYTLPTPAPGEPFLFKAERQP